MYVHGIYIMNTRLLWDGALDSHNKLVNEMPGFG
jgi:hypothetical protein